MYMGNRKHAHAHTQSQTLLWHMHFVQQLSAAHMVDFKAASSPRNRPFFTGPVHLKYHPDPRPFPLCLIHLHSIP